MCLDQISDKPPEPEGEGWRIFAVIVKDDERFYMPLYYGTDMLFQTNKWYKNTEKVEVKVYNKPWHMLILSNSEGPKYISGFHIFKRREDAERYVKSLVIIDQYSIEENPWSKLAVKKVRYKDARVQGGQLIPLISKEEAPVVVADQMYIEE